MGRRPCKQIGHLQTRNMSTVLLPPLLHLVDRRSVLNGPLTLQNIDQVSIERLSLIEGALDFIALGLVVSPEQYMMDGLPETTAGSTGRCNTGLEFTGRSFKAQGFSRALIQAQRYFVEFGLRINR